jgi:ribosome-associated heat shock protein Hsp15
MESKYEVRIDKWLWAVRIFKSRALAAEACKKERVIIGNNEVKASHHVKLNDIIKVKQSPVVRIFRVKGIPPSRVSAKLAAEYKEDITPPEELKKLEASRLESVFYRQKGQGRPTKKNRRAMDKWDEDKR